MIKRFVTLGTCLVVLRDPQIIQRHRERNQPARNHPSQLSNAALNIDRLVNITKTGPLGNYTRYPCLSGIPVFSKKENSETGKCVRTINITAIDVKKRENCVPMKTLKGSTTICTHPVDKDVYVSKALQLVGLWEETMVFNIARFLQSEPSAEFLDIGCNIGTYALAIAHQGTKVTAVDPLLNNLELLAKSLKLGNLQKNVTLVWNAVSKEHALITLNVPQDNFGGTNIQDISLLGDSVDNPHVSWTITLDDLVPMFKGKRLVIKMDIEGSEYKALLGGSIFFDSVDIILLQMEFSFHRHGEDGQHIVEFLKSKGLEPYLDMEKRVPLISSDSYVGDVYFLKP